MTYAMHSKDTMNALKMLEREFDKLTLNGVDIHTVQDLKAVFRLVWQARTKECEVALALLEHVRKEIEAYDKIEHLPDFGGYAQHAWRVLRDALSHAEESTGHKIGERHDRFMPSASEIMEEELGVYGPEIMLHLTDVKGQQGFMHGYRTAITLIRNGYIPPPLKDAP